MKMLGHFGVLFGFIVLSSASYDIANQNLTNWGDWGTYEVCSNGTFAQGFQLKVEESQGCGTDDSALNGIRLYCRKPNDFLSLAQIISSSVGQYGSWKHVFLCFPGYITGFGLRVEPELNGLHDNSAANNVRFHCSNREDFVLGDGMAWGRWMPDQHCNEGDAICGIQTQVHEAECCDKTALNNIKFKCCPLSNSEVSTTTTVYKDDKTMLTVKQKKLTFTRWSTGTKSGSVFIRSEIINVLSVALFLVLRQENIV